MRARFKKGRNYAAYQQMGRGGFGLGRQGVVGREYGDVGPGGEGGVQTVPWPWEVAGREAYARQYGQIDEIVTTGRRLKRGIPSAYSKYPATRYRMFPKTPQRYAPQNVTRSCASRPENVDCPTGTIFRHPQWGWCCGGPTR